jgi:hypothetical protein
MSIIATQTENKTEYEIVPSGTHIARCYSMIHIGTIEEEYMGEKKDRNKVRLTWEIPTELRDYHRGEGRKPKKMPMTISKEYTLSMYEMANLRKDLESWRGKALTEVEAKSFDITKLLGVPSMISVVHKTSKKGKDYAYISTISPMMKGQTCPDMMNNKMIFDYNDNFNTQWLNSECPEWLRDNIKASQEFNQNLDNNLESDNDDMPF